MADICMCANEVCPIRDKCYRFTAHKNEMWQSYATFEYHCGCPFFVDNRDWAKKEKK